MKGVSSNNRPQLVECTNKHVNVWMVRWGVEQQETEDEKKSVQFVYQEKRFTAHFPTFEEIVDAILESGVSATAQELTEIIETVGEDLNAAKKLVLANIDMYDRSDNVNHFSVNGYNMWLDKQTRTSLSYTISVEEQTRSDNKTTLWYEGEPPVSFVLPIELLKQMLSSLELYAKDTYNITQNHKAQVCQLNSVKEIINFDITADYPEKLNFTF